MAIAIIDVDLTIINPAINNSGLDWFTWLNLRAKDFAEGRDIYKDLENNCCEYNLSKYFVLEDGTDPMQYWRQEDLYRYMKPYDDAIEVVNKLCERHEVVFASYCKAGHMSSKYEMLLKYFPKFAGFHATKEKGYLKADWVFDDRNIFLNQFDNSVQKFKMRTPYTQEVELKNEPDVFIMDSWRHWNELFGDCI